MARATSRDRRAPLPRKAPSQARSRSTVRAILQAAARVLATDSLEGFNTNRVAAVAGVSVGSLYQYFPNKDVLIAELIDTAQSELADAVEAAVYASESMSLNETVAVIALIAVNQQYEHPLLAAALDHEELRLAPSVAVRGATERILANVTTILSRHRARLTVTDIDVASRDCLAIAKGIVDEAARVSGVRRSGLERDVARALVGYLTVPLHSYVWP